MQGIAEALSGKSECDVAADDAQEIPARVIAVMLSLPDIKESGSRIGSRGFGDPATARRVRAEMTEYVTEQVASRGTGEPIINV
jgi:cytochrome P450